MYFAAIFSLLRYYALDVSYFKSSLDRRLLEMLWNKYWVNTLSSSSLLTVNAYSYFFNVIRNSSTQHVGSVL